jgi:hypothetical protein
VYGPLVKLVKKYVSAVTKKFACLF